MRRPLVLHADPHADTREMLACMLRVHAIDVIGAPNGVEAYEIAVRERPDVVVTELALPLADGCTLCRRIRCVAGLQQVPVIAWTGWLDARGVHALAESGFNRVLMKAGDSDIVAEVTSFLRIWRVG